MNTSNPRIEKLQQLLVQQKTEAILVTRPVDIEYLLGVHLSTGKLLVFQKSAYLFVDGRYLNACQEKIKSCEVLFYTDAILIDCLTSRLIPESTLLFDSSISYAEFLQLEQLLLPTGLQLQPQLHPIRSLRAIKDAHEIQALRQAAFLGSQGFDFACRQLEVDISEAEVALRLEIFWKQHGGQKTAFDPIIAFGANTANPHHRPGITTLKKHDPVLIDIGVVLQGYHSDMTRVVFFGEPSDPLKEIYHVVLKAQKSALELCRPGIELARLDRVAREVIREAGYEEYFVHSLGHGVGLEIHEFPTLKSTKENEGIFLEKGMVITIEPGIYLPGQGGVRLEDTIVITEGGYEDLTLRPKDLRIM